MDETGTPEDRFKRENENSKLGLEDWSESRNLIIFKVSSKSNVKLMGDAISHYISEGRAVELLAIGAGAVNQAIKSFIIAQDFLVRNRRFVVMDAYFRNTEISTVDGPKETTLIAFKLMKVDEMPKFPVRK